MSSYEHDSIIQAIVNDAPITKSGNRFVPYPDILEGSYLKSQLRQEDGSAVTIGTFRYVLRIYNGSALVFRNPVKSSNNTNVNINPKTRPSNNAQTQSQTQLDGGQIITKLSEIVAKLSEITSVVKCTR